MREIRWKCIFRANFSLLPKGFDARPLIPQGLAGSPNYFGFFINLVTLTNCDSLKEIGEMACVTSTRSSRGQTLKPFKAHHMSTSSLSIMDATCIFPRCFR